MLEHFLKCTELPEDKIPELNDATSGSFQRRRTGGGGRKTQTVVMHPLVSESAQVGNHGGGNCAARAGLSQHVAQPACQPAGQPAGQQAAREGPMLQFVDSVTGQQAAEINMAITKFIVGCGLPFAIVQSAYFIALLSILRPGFVVNDWLMSRSWFSSKGLDDLYAQIKERLDKTFSSTATTSLYTLAGDGFKTEAGDKVVNFTEQLQSWLAFKDSHPVGVDREDVDMYVPLFKAQLETRPIIDWAGVVADNVRYMRNTLTALVELFPTLLSIGCVAHVLDLLCEDFAKLLDETVNTAKTIVLFIVQHDRLRQLFLRIKGPQGVGLRTFPDTRFGYACLMIQSVLSNKRHLRDMVDDASWEDVSQNKDGSAVANRELFLDVVDTRSKWEDMQCAVNLLLPVSDALQFIEGNTTRVSFVYLIMLHIGNDVAQWTSGALDGVLLDGQEPLSVKAFRAFHARWGATGRIQAGLYDDVHMVAYFLDPFLCRLVEELPLNAIGAFQKIFGKFCDDVELAQCVNEFMKFHNGDGGYGMMKDFAEQTHQREFARLKEKYLRDHNLGKLPHCVSEAIMYCQAAMSNGNCAITWWKTMGKTVKSAKKLSEIARGAAGTPPVPSFGCTFHSVLPCRMSPAPRPHTYHLRHLDGSRGLAVMLVMAYHMGVPCVQQAWLFISGFFCMSGLLITGLTVEAFQRRGKVDVLGFWSRRVARLFPALFILVIAIALSRLFRTEDDVQLWMERSDMWWALGYLTNVNLVYFRKDDYFAETSRPSITRHLWTLSIEEQYYIAWPLLFLLWTRLFVPARKPSSDAGQMLLPGAKENNTYERNSNATKYEACVRALAVGECVVMALSYLSSVWTIRQLGLSAAYYSTLCRAGDFAAGGLVYCLIRLSPSIYPRYSQQPGLPSMSTSFRVKLEMGSLLSLALLLLTPMMPGKPEELLTWYFYVFRIPYGLIVMASFIPGALQISEPLPRWALVTRLLTSKPLTTLGFMAYGQYLFHWPLIVYLGTPVDHETFGSSEGLVDATAGSASLVWNVGLFGLPIALSVVSFWLVEKPLMMAARKYSKTPGKAETLRPSLPLPPPMLGLLQRLVSMQPPGAVMVVCDTLTPLNPCDYGPWNNGTRWVWLRSPVLCRKTPLNQETPADVMRRCPGLLHVSALEMGGMQPDGGVDAVALTDGSKHADGGSQLAGCKSAKHPGCEDIVNQDPDGRTVGGLKAYTALAALDNIYLMQLMMKLELVIPGAIHQGSQASVRRRLVKETAKLRRARPKPAGAGLDEELRVVVMGESVAQRLGGIFRELVDASSGCQEKERQHTTAFPHVKSLNLARSGHPLLLYFLDCRPGLPASAYDSASRVGVCAEDGTQRKHHTVRQQVRTAMMLSKPDVLAIHDAYWSTNDHLVGYAPFLPEAMTNFLKHARAASVKTVVMMTPSMSSKKDEDTWRYVAADLGLYQAYFNATQCKAGQQGITVVLLDWHRLTCPAYEQLAASSRKCPVGAHGFHNIMPDGQHPSGPSGDWLGAQVLAAILAQTAMDSLGHSTWEAALRNPVSSCMLKQHPPASGDVPLRDLLHVHRVCPP
eukprot:jgi/Tetstr1/460730/TSEL_005916.t1